MAAQCCLVDPEAGPLRAARPRIVQPCHRRLAATHAVEQAGVVERHHPGVLRGVAFDKPATRAAVVGVCKELRCAVARLHIAGHGIERIGPVRGATEVGVISGAVAQGPRKLGDAEVIGIEKNAAAANAANNVREITASPRRIRSLDRPFLQADNSWWRAHIRQACDKRIDVCLESAAFGAPGNL